MKHIKRQKKLKTSLKLKVISMVKIGIIMGSKSDFPVMKEAAEILNDFGISYETEIVSAHRTPDKMMDYSKNAHKRGIKVIIAGAGGAAHLPGMVASNSPLPVIGIPIKSKNSIDGWDSILSILQMPDGVPVATVALNGAKNGAILAAEILGINDTEIQKKIINYKLELERKVNSSKLK
tara:strand:+ start:27080 stop:27616 length:537 start_codon:yes stop_codon:yes gene_type:complete